MTPPLSRHALISACLLSKLGNIVAGDVFNFTPDGGAVVRATQFSVDYLEAGYDMIYLLRAEDENLTEGVSGETEHVAEFFVLGAKRYQVGGTEPFNVDAPTRSEIQDAIAEDVRRAILADVMLRTCQVPSGSLPGGYYNAMVTDVDRTIVVASWAVVQVRIEVHYDSSMYAS